MVESKIRELVNKEIINKETSDEQLKLIYETMKYKDIDLNEFLVKCDYWRVKWLELKRLEEAFDHKNKVVVCDICGKEHGLWCYDFYPLFKEENGEYCGTCCGECHQNLFKSGKIDYNGKVFKTPKPMGKCDKCGKETVEDWLIEVYDNGEVVGRYCRDCVDDYTYFGRDEHRHLLKKYYVERCEEYYDDGCECIVEGTADTLEEIVEIASRINNCNYHTICVCPQCGRHYVLDQDSCPNCGHKEEIDPDMLKRLKGE